MRKNKNISKPKKPVFSFVADGKCEFWYLQLLRQYEGLYIYLEPELPQKKKLQNQYDLVETLSEESEKVFWIIDFDTILKETRETPKGNKTPLQDFYELYKKSKKNKKVVVIVNNPCFEYWLLLHFEQTSKYFPTGEKLEKQLKKYLKDYEKTQKYYKNYRQNIYQKLKPNLPFAISNAEKLGEFDFTNTATGMLEMDEIFRELKMKI